MKVLHLVKTTRGAGWALNQMRELARRGVDCHVVLPDILGHAREYTAAGVTVHVAEIDAQPLTPRFVSGAAKLRALVRTVRPDVVHSHFVASTLLMRFALAGQACPRVFQVPGPLHLENRVTAALDLATAGAHDYWIASCEWTRKRYITSGVSAARVFLSYYGLDISNIQLAQAGAFRKELGIGPQTRLIGMVAHCYRPKAYLGARRGIKGHEDFIDAIQLLRHRGWNVLGIVVGGAWNGGERYFERVQRYGASKAPAAIRFVGHRSDVPSIYADLAVAVHPSLSENLGGAAESLLLGVPTVTTAVGGFPDLIEDGITGLLAPPRCPERLAHAIGKLLADPVKATEMGNRGRNRARQLLELKSTVDRIVDIYHRISDAPIRTRSPLDQQSSVVS